MVEQIFSRLPEAYRSDAVTQAASFYFSIDGIKRTVLLHPEGCEVQIGKTVDVADCICKMGSEMFLRIWNEGYMPGMKDFLSGAVKSNDPQRLKFFLQVFGKNC